ncbi:MAG: type II toxin-antitoxin system HicB family antitoxin [Planctomycetota bacterium]
MKTPSYHINIFFSAEDRGFVADIPDLVHCSAFGATPQAALEEVVRARDAWLLAAKRAGKSTPKARYRPAIYQVAK